ncbi:MAG: 4a-hydroxytetrahydrobiopterin dehydratase [Pseudomonadota bacterium]
MKLADQHCVSVVTALAPEAIEALLPQLPGWSVHDGQLARRFALRDYHETMAFVNALAWMTHREDHHPELRVGYKDVEVRYDTHSVHGISHNDFICAARASALYEQRTGA